MSNIPILTGLGDEAYLKSSGAGTSGDPFIPEQTMKQATHDDLNGNANLQVNNADVGMANPVPVKFGTSIALPAGENHMGAVGKPATVVDVTLALDTSQYADGDVLSETAAVASAVRTNAGIGKLVSLAVIDGDDQGQAMDIYLLSSNVAMGSANAAPSISDANAGAILGMVAIGTAQYRDLGGVKVATLMENDLGMLVKGAAGIKSIYLATISRGTGTYSASGVKLRLGIEQY